MYHGIEIDRYGFEATKSLSPPLVLAGTSLVPQKGLDDVIAALAILRRNGVSFRAEIIGQGSQRKALESQIAAEGLKDIVELIGTRTHRDVIDLMRQAAVFVMASKRASGGFIDGLPNVVAEAMACGACVVGTRFSGIPELVDDGVDGLLVEPGDYGALAGAIGRVLGDSGLRETLSRNARGKVESTFDLQRNVEPIADYFEQILSGDKNRDVSKV